MGFQEKRLPTVITTLPPTDDDIPLIIHLWQSNPRGEVPTFDQVKRYIDHPHSIFVKAVQGNEFLGFGAAVSRPTAQGFPPYNVLHSIRLNTNPLHIPTMDTILSGIVDKIVRKNGTQLWCFVDDSDSVSMDFLTRNAFEQQNSLRNGGQAIHFMVKQLTSTGIHYQSYI